MMMLNYEAALDLRAMGARLTNALRDAGAAHAVEVLEARIVAHEPVGRCTVAYDVMLTRPDGVPDRATLLGTMRVASADRATPALLRAFRSAGFTEHGQRAFCVPEPLGVIPELHMWLQRQASGVPAYHLFDGDFELLADRIVGALHELHHTAMPVTRTHTVEDELHILRERCTQLGEQQPTLRASLERLLTGCVRLAIAMGDVAPRRIHRDFRPDNVMVDDHGRVWVTSFEQYGSGDPALDMGNFIAHITALALGTHGDAHAFAAHEHALTEAYVRHAGVAAARRVHVCALLALARQTAMSSHSPDRQHITTAMLQLCEERMHLARRRETQRVRFA
jgi:thiamine kinase-like enzyme